MSHKFALRNFSIAPRRKFKKEYKPHQKSKALCRPTADDDQVINHEDEEKNDGNMQSQTVEEFYMMEEEEEYNNEKMQSNTDDENEDEQMEELYCQPILMQGGGVDDDLSSDDADSAYDDNLDDDDEQNKDDQIENKAWKENPYKDLTKRISALVNNHVNDYEKEVEKQKGEFTHRDEFDDPVFTLSDSTKCGTSVRQLAEKVRAFTAKHKLGVEAEADFFRICQDIVPQNSKLPIIVGAKSHKIISKIDKVLNTESTNGLIELDMCKNGCCVFVNDLVNAQFCPTCNEGRYYACKQCSSDLLLCSHTRAVQKKLVYKCIIPMLVSLISNEGFLDSLNYRVYPYKNGDSASYISDISHGSAYLEAMQSMTNDFNKFKRTNQKFPINNDSRKQVSIDETWQHVKLCFSTFYDGIQLHTTRTKLFAPFLLTILNIPSPFREKLSMGKFMYYCIM